MAGESNKAQETGKNLDVLATEKNDSATIVKKKRKGVLSRIWNGLFRQHGDDFEKRLQHISKEEATVLARMQKRSRSWRRMIRHLIIFSVIFEVIAVIYAIMTTRSLDLNWKMRAFRVLPMFLLPGLLSITYSALVTFTRMCDRKDQKTLEKLRAERQEKIDELKEKTNYYITQQLIQCNSTVAGEASKKARVHSTPTLPPLKVRKEKLGDRITALHQLVAPFGKTDTASVLIEAIGYIRFLQSQIELLSSPYLGNASANMMHQQSVEGERNCTFQEDYGQGREFDEPKDLRSRGLCLVPISCTQHVGSENGADYWAPSLGGGF